MTTTTARKTNRKAPRTTGRKAPRKAARKPAAPARVAAFSEVSAAGGFAIVAPDDAMLGADPRRVICCGDVLIGDREMKPVAGDIVVARDPISGIGIIRTYCPLHPSDARAPGYVLKAAHPGFVDVLVKGTAGIVAVITERRVMLRG